MLSIIEMNHEATITSVVIGLLACAVLIGLTIAISCVKYYGGEKKEDTKREVERTRQRELDLEIAKIKLTDRSTNGPTGEDVMARAEAEDRIANAIRTQNAIYVQQQAVIQDVIDAENARRELFGLNK